MVEVYGEVYPAGMVEEDHQNVCVRCPYHTGLVAPLDLRSNQEETDSRVVVYLHQAVKCMHRILWEDCTSGEDCTSAFGGRGGVAPLKKLQKNPKYQRAFSQLGEDWLVTDELQQEMESFTCIMYGNGQIKSVDAVRAKMLKKMVVTEKVLDSRSKADLERLPPPKVCLIPHVQHVNFRVACYKRADQPIIERPNTYDECMGWEKTMDEGVLEPVWTNGPILPASLVEVLA